MARALQKQDVLSPPLRTLITTFIILSPSPDTLSLYTHESCYFLIIHSLSLSLALFIYNNIYL